MGAEASGEPLVFDVGGGFRVFVALPEDDDGQGWAVMIGRSETGWRSDAAHLGTFRRDDRVGAVDLGLRVAAWVAEARRAPTPAEVRGLEDRGPVLPKESAPGSGEAPGGAGGSALAEGRAFSCHGVRLRSTSSLLVDALGLASRVVDVLERCGGRSLDDEGDRLAVGLAVARAARDSMPARIAREGLIELARGGGLTARDRARWLVAIGDLCGLAVEVSDAG